LGHEELWRRIGYSDKVIDHFMNPRNIGEMEDADVTATVGSMACGDVIKLFLKFDEKGERIEKISFLSYGCAANIAATSVLTEMVKGRTIEEAKSITFREILEELGGLPAIKHHCAILSVSGLRMAIAKYEVKVGRRKLNEDFVRLVLRGILDPILGRDLISVGRVKGISVDGRRIRISLDLEKGSPAAEVVEAELKEAFEGLDVKLEILFKEV